jgi:hypothetical protein
VVDEVPQHRRASRTNTTTITTTAAAATATTTTTTTTTTTATTTTTTAAAAAATAASTPTVKKHLCLEGRRSVGVAALHEVTELLVDRIVEGVARVRRQRHLTRLQGSALPLRDAWLRSSVDL